MPPTTTALVTGATHGIGRATAFALGRAGYRVGVCARTGGKVESLVAELRAAGIEAAGRPADVADPVAVSGVVDHISRTLGEIGVLVNNAGVLIARPIEELTLEDWDATMATNLRGLFLMTRAVLPPMRARKRGDIVNVASLSARSGFAGGSAYAASKHAVLGFGRSLMLELRKEGIRVVTVCPGSVDTGMLRDQPMLPSNPDRILHPEDVAETILHSLRLPERALVSEIDLRPSNP
ncbi:MAG: SDR family NAD(P)-dependent oxidoreductase [Gemmatimonadales bacterium]|nr:SDR family NAD(P)-dependent oxidoreductase [Gemmatimonadales bacterium]